jgi:hypothetical protein
MKAAGIAGRTAVGMAGRTAGRKAALGKAGLAPPHVSPGWRDGATRSYSSGSASRLALPPAAVVLTVTTCSAAKRAR